MENENSDCWYGTPSTVQTSIYSRASGNLFNPIIEKSELDERVKRNIEMQTEKLKASSVQLEELLGE